jgi:hypothetical protein
VYSPTFSKKAYDMPPYKKDLQGYALRIAYLYFRVIPLNFNCCWEDMTTRTSCIGVNENSIKQSQLSLHCHYLVSRAMSANAVLQMVVALIDDSIHPIQRFEMRDILPANGQETAQ